MLRQPFAIPNACGLTSKNNVTSVVVLTDVATEKRIAKYPSKVAHNGVNLANQQLISQCVTWLDTEVKCSS